MSTNRATRTGMKLGSLGAAVVVVVAACLAARAPSAAAADRLEREGASPVEGRLLLDPGSGFRFRPAGAPDGSAVPVEAGRAIDLGEGGPSPTTNPPLFQAQVGEVARISGTLERVSGTGVRLAVPWQEGPIEVRRPGVQAVVQRFGEARVLVDSFDAVDDATWTVGGKLAIVDDAGPAADDRALAMPPGGASIEHRFGEPLNAGRVDLTFRDDGKVHPEQDWTLALTFRTPAGPATVRVVLGWAEDSLAVESPLGPTLAVQRLARAEGWRRLAVRFDADRTEVAVDGAELAHGKGPSGPLESIRLATSGPESASAGRGGLVGEVQVVRFVRPPSSLEIDPSQDEARLVVGDQLFGAVLGGDADRIEMTVDDRPTSLGWGDLAGLHLRRTPAEGDPVRGALARVEWRAWDGDPAGDLDFAEGAVTGLSDATLTLATPFAGVLAIPRDRLTRLQVLPAGWRRVIDPCAHHLGDEISATPPLLDPPHPEGGVLERSFTAPEGVDGPRFLVLDVVQVVGEASGLPFSEFVRRGELKTFVELNGVRFDYLNRYVRTANDDPERIRIPIAADLLKAGENRLRIVQTGIANNATWYDDLGILCIAVEVEAAGSPKDSVTVPSP